jgi:hypothetical protein
MLKLTGSARTAVIAASAGIAIATVGLTGQVAAAAKTPSHRGPSSVILTSRTISIKTSTHKKLKLEVNATDFVSLGKPDSSPAAVAARLSAPDGHESHTWNFQLAAGSFIDHVATSKGTAATGAHQIAPYGRIALDFSPIGSSSTLHCGKTKVVTQHVTITARMSLKTGTAWGSAGGYPAKTHVGRGTLRTQYGGAPCPPPAPFTSCVASVSWSAGTAPVTLSGGWTRRHGMKLGQITATRLTFLSTPTEATRIDSVTTTAPSPTLVDSAGLPTMTVTTSGGRATGSASLTSTTVENPSKVTCDSTHHHDLQTTWLTASFTNGTKPLTVHEQVEGAMTVANTTTDGYIQRNTRLN